MAVDRVARAPAGRPRAAWPAKTRRSWVHEGQRIGRAGGPRERRGARRRRRGDRGQRRGAGPQQSGRPDGGPRPAWAASNGGRPGRPATRCACRSRRTTSARWPSCRPARAPRSAGSVRSIPGRPAHPVRGSLGDAAVSGDALRPTTTPGTPIVFAGDAEACQARADVVDVAAGDGAGAVAGEHASRTACPRGAVGTDRFSPRWNCRCRTRRGRGRARTRRDHVTVAWREPQHVGSQAPAWSAVDAARAFEGRSRRFEVGLDDPHAAAAGWHPMERRAGRWFRWTADRSADIVRSPGAHGDVRVRVDASPATGSAGRRRGSAAVNGMPVGPPGGREGPAIRWWLVPAERWRTG